jgi:phosphotransferase system enzyme I (PtsI)
MKTYSGKSVFQGVAIGKIVELKKTDDLVRRKHITDIEYEKKRFFEAQEKAKKQLSQLYDKAVKEVGEANAAIFEIHQMMLEDDDYVDSIHNIICSQSVNAEYAVAATGENFSTMFATMDDEYMKARAADIKDISNRLIQVLKNTDDSTAKLTEKSIIVADDLAPSETVQLDKEKVLAFVTRQGSTNSHTAILARTMNIPALVSVPVPNDIDGKMAIVNGFKGEVIMEPEEKELKKAMNLQKEEAERKKLLLEYKGKPTVTKSGKKIKLYANIGGVSDMGAVLQNDAAGIGLFRSEFLYLQDTDYPSEDKQFQSYRRVAEMMAGKRVIIRTLDIGADKQIDYFQLDKEGNPALGYRAVRICLTREDIFRTQLRALLRASAFGKVAIMVPMIISVWEVKKTKDLIETIKEELISEKIPFGKIEFGVMIETPAAVMMAEELAKEVDFFSIGTNDLTQYTLAIDRQNPKLDFFYDAHHPAVLKMIQMTVESGHKAGIWVGICGELGADTNLTRKFMEMGVDELSVAPGMILPLRKLICEIE